LLSNVFAGKVEAYTTGGEISKAMDAIKKERREPVAIYAIGSALDLEDTDPALESSVRPFFRRSWKSTFCT